MRAWAERRFISDVEALRRLASARREHRQHSFWANGNSDVGNNPQMVLAPNGSLTVVSGCISATNIVCASDAELKQDVRPLSYGLRELTRLRPVKWNWKHATTRQLNFGLVAQEVQPVLPELILHGVDEKGSLGLNYMGLIPVLIPLNGHR
jgi:hypothetical protein